jgi:hypothetical protein
MIAPRIFKLDGIEQTALPILARIYKLVAGTGKTPITQSDLTSISRKIMRMNLNSGAFGNVSEPDTGTSITVATAVYNSLQTDTAWWKDTIGYNFADVVPAAKFPGLGAYSIVYTFTPSSPTVAVFPFIIRCNVVSLQGTLSEG